MNPKRLGLIIALLLSMLLIASCALVQRSLNLSDVTITHQEDGRWQVEVKEFSRQVEGSTQAELTLFHDGEQLMNGTGALSNYQSGSTSVKVGKISVSIPIYAVKITTYVDTLPFDPTNPPAGTYRLRICEPLPNGEVACSNRESQYP